MRFAPLTRAALALTVGALSLVSTGASQAAARPPVPGAERIDGGWAVPAPTTGPSWYDAAYARKVMASGTQGVRLPEGATMPGGAKAVGLATTGIRPGTWLVTLLTGQGGQVGFAWCTANFVFIKNGVYGLGTAGHCAANDALGGFPDVTAYVVPPVGSGSLPGFYHIGKFVLSHNNGIGDDFAMIQIYPQFNSWMNPGMPVWGGPTGVYTSNLVTVVKHFGHGLGVGAGGTPRAGVAPIWTARGGTAFGWYGVGFEGDSGSAVNVVTGEGAGNFTHIVISDGIPGQLLPGMLAGTRLTKIQSIATGWTLQLSSLVPSP
jgi:hypothetical protein